MKGRFILHSGVAGGEPDSRNDIILPNQIMNDWDKAILQIIFQNVAVIPAGLFLGLCGANLNGQGQIDRTKTLGTFAGEPAIANGYARQGINRDGTAAGWPTLTQVNGVWMAQSKIVTITAAGGNIGPVFRAFLATTNDNTGRLIAMSAQFNAGAGDTIINGTSRNLSYQIYQE